MKTINTFFILAMLGIPTAQASEHQAHAKTAATAAAPLSEGEIRKVDKAAGKLTIKHGALTNLDMPPMTMVFRVKEAAVLDQVKPGDRIKFRAEHVSGALTVTQLEVVAP